MTKKKVLLTGANGFIGSVVLQAIEQDYEVISVGRNSECKIKLDLCEVPADFLLEDKYYALVHCAGAIDEEFRTDAIRAWSRTVHGFPKLLAAAQKAGIERLVDISTAHIYGKQEGIITEESKVNPLSDYALAHYVTEQLCKRSLIPSMVIRPSTIYGAGKYLDHYTRYGLIPYAFPNAMVKKQLIEIHTSGLQGLNFVHIDTVVDIVVQYLSEKKPLQFQIQNAAGNRTLSVIAYAKMVADEYERQTGICGKIETKPDIIIGDINFQFCTTTNLELSLGEAVEDDVCRLIARLLTVEGKK